jgi:hypothetical protein
MDTDGNQRAKVKIVAEHVEFKPQKKEEKEAESESEASSTGAQELMEEEADSAVVF